MSASETINIRQEPYFTLPFKLIAITIIFSVIFFYYQQLDYSRTFNIIVWLKIISSIIAIPICVILLTAHHGVLIDKTHKSVLVYVWILGFKTGTPKYFNYIERIYINGVKLSSRKTTSTGRIVIFKDYVYKAYIALDDGEKIHLDTDKSEEKLITRIEGLKKNIGSLYRPT